MAFSSKIRIENDSLGQIEIPENCYYGSETARSIKNFNIGLPTDQIPLSIIQAFAVFKKACAMINIQFGLNKNISNTIVQACDSIIAGHLNDQFPLSIWQTISGAQTNVNINEVIANRAIELLGGVIGSKTPVHPIDHVNKNQRSDQTFSIAMHIAATFELNGKLHPALKHLQEVLRNKSDDFSSMSIGQIHLQEAIPTILSQEFSGYIQQISMNIEDLNTCQTRLYQLAIDHIAVGKGINTPQGFGKYVARRLEALTGFPFIDVPNNFEELNTYTIMVELSGALNRLAISLMKIVNDIRLVGSKPRCGIGKLILSEKKSAMTMVAAQVMSNHVGLTVGVSMGHFEVNVFKPLIIKNILHSIRILGDACRSINDHFIVGIKLITNASTTFMPELPMDNTIIDNKKYFEENVEQRKNLSTATTSLTSSTRRGELGSNGTLLSSRTESHIVPHLNKVGEPEKFIPPSFSSSANEDVFGNVVGARSIAATTTTQMNSNMEGESVITRHLNKVGQPEKFIPPSFSSSANEDVFGNVVGARSIAATTTTQMNSNMEGESVITRHLNKVGQPEKFIPPSFSSSANENVFGNVVGARSIAATTTTQMNSNMEGESVITRHLNKVGQPEKFIPPSFSSSANENVFGNVVGARSIAATTTTQMNSNIEGESAITRHLNLTSQLDPSTYINNLAEQLKIFPPPPQ